MSNKRSLVMDIELFANYLLVMFKAIDSKVVRSFEFWANKPEDATDVPVFNLAQVDHARTIEAILRKFTIVSFNGQDFDFPILFYAMQRGASISELKQAANHIIDGRLRAWQFSREYNVQIPTWLDHIDLREPVPGVQISLKLYGGRLHSKKLQDLPYEPDRWLTDAEMDEVRTYCENDCDTTIDLYNKARDPKDDIIGTRELLSAEFGIDVRSKSDAQIAETLIRTLVERRTGQKVYPTDVRPGTRYAYRPPAFIRFNSPLLQAKLDEICGTDFYVGGDGAIVAPKSLEGATLKIGEQTYRMGIGGLHSTEQTVAHIASEQTLLRDRDVVSYYPSLILQCGLSPDNMGRHFQEVYGDFFRRRVAAKKAGHKSSAQTLKILLNGAFGKLGSRFSVLYAPNLLIQVTVTGQLELLMMIERMEAAGIPCVSANTDGVVMACPAHLEPEMLRIVAQWEREATAERTRDALAHLRSEGVRLGGAALGWERGEGVDAAGRRVVVAVEDEADTVARILALKADGVSVRRIAEILAAEGRRTKAGGQWHPTTVQRVIARGVA